MVVRFWARLAKDSVRTEANERFASVAQTPAVQALQRRVEKGGAVFCAGVCPSAQPFLSALLRHLFPCRPVVVVTAGLKTQESFHQDIATWLAVRKSIRKPPSPASFSPNKIVSLGYLQDGLAHDLEAHRLRQRLETVRPGIDQKAARRQDLLAGACGRSRA